MSEYVEYTVLYFNASILGSWEPRKGLFSLFFLYGPTIHYYCVYNVSTQILEAERPLPSSPAPFSREESYTQSLAWWCPSSS